MHRRGRRFPLLLVVLLGSSVLAGCPSVDPGSLDPPLLEGEVNLHFQISCHFSGPGKGDPLAVQDRVRRNFEENLVRTYTLHEKNQVLAAVKSILNHPGLLRSLEVNRCLASFVRACAEDRWLTFYRQDDLVKAEPFRDAARRQLEGTGELEISLANQAFNIFEDVTPQIFTFTKPALKVPLEKVELGFKPEALRVTLTIRDEKVIGELHRKVGWPEPNSPFSVSSESFAERISLERKLYAVVAGVVLIEDIIRPGAQIIEDDRGLGWAFGGFVRAGEKDWAETLFKRDDGRTIERFVIKIWRTPAEPKTEP